MLDAHGSSIYANTAAGLEPALRSVALLPAHGELTWVDDQIQPAGVPASVHAIVGQAASTAAVIPRLEVSGAPSSEAAGELAAEGSVVNRSAVAQRELVVYAIARKGSEALAAGRDDVRRHGRCADLDDDSIVRDVHIAAASNARVHDTAAVVRDNVVGK